MSGARLGAGGKAFNKTDMVPALGVDSLVGRAGMRQVLKHMIIATEAGLQDTLGTVGDGSVRSVQEFRAWSPSSLCQPALLFTIWCDLG